MSVTKRSNVTVTQSENNQQNTRAQDKEKTFIKFIFFNAEMQGRTTPHDSGRLHYQLHAKSHLFIETSPLVLVTQYNTFTFSENVSGIQSKLSRLTICYLSSLSALKSTILPLSPFTLEGAQVETHARKISRFRFKR